MEGEAHASECLLSPNQFNDVSNTDLLLHRLRVAAMDYQVDAQAHERLSGMDIIQNGKHLVAWSRVQHPFSSVG
jgi:hypothetical protein